jgi:hypothetical protein
VSTVVCPSCGLSYGRATITHHVHAAAGASCPRCGTALTDAGRGATRGRRPRLGSTPERHRAALARTLSWAEEAAASGDYSTALSWLATIEAVEGGLPPAVDAKQRAWAQRARSRRAHA